MTTTVSASSGQYQENPLALPLLGIARKGQESGNSVVDGHWILPIVAQAIDDCMSRKEAAIRLGLNEGTLSRQLSGADGKCINFEKFGQLGEPVAVAFCHRLRQHFGLNDPAERLQRALSLITTGLNELVSEVRR